MGDAQQRGLHARPFAKAAKPDGIQRKALKFEQCTTVRRHAKHQLFVSPVTEAECSSLVFSNRFKWHRVWPGRDRMFLHHGVNGVVCADWLAVAMSHDIDSEQRVLVFCEIRYDGDVACSQKLVFLELNTKTDLTGVTAFILLLVSPHCSYCLPHLSESVLLIFT